MGTNASQMIQVEYIVNPIYFASLKFSEGKSILQNFDAISTVSLCLFYIKASIYYEIDEIITSTFFIQEYFPY